MIFTQAFPPKSGTGKNGKPYTRWDYKTAAEERFCHFEGVDPIPVNTEVALELNPSGTIKSWKATGAVLPEGNPQTTQMLHSGSRAVTLDYTAKQRDFKAEAEGKTRCALVSTLLPAMFTANVEAGGEPSPENARVLLDWAFKYVFQTDEIPF